MMTNHNFKVGDRIQWKLKSEEWDKPNDYYQNRVYVVGESGRAVHKDGGYIDLKDDSCDYRLVEPSCSNNNVNHPSHYNQAQGIESTGGPSDYYDFPKGWKTWNDLADYKSQKQWKEHSFHLGNVGKAIYRWGEKSGTTKTYDAKKIVYSGLRVLMMLEGKETTLGYLKELIENEQFND